MTKFSGKKLEAVKQEVITAAQAMYDESKAIFPIDPKRFDDIYDNNIVFKRDFSQVYFAKDGRVVGFALAWYNLTNTQVHLEKLGVMKNFRGQGIARKMMHALAVQAKAAQVKKIALFVLKTNKSVHKVYEKFSFKNETPLEIQNDPRFDAFLYEANTDELLKKTLDPMPKTGTAATASSVSDVVETGNGMSATGAGNGVSAAASKSKDTSAAAGQKTGNFFF